MGTCRQQASLCSSHINPSHPQQVQFQSAWGRGIESRCLFTQGHCHSQREPETYPNPETLSSLGVEEQVPLSPLTTHKSASFPFPLSLPIWRAYWSPYFNTGATIFLDFCVQGEQRRMGMQEKINLTWKGLGRGWQIQQFWHPGDIWKCLDSWDYRYLGAAKNSSMHRTAPP